MQVGPDCTCVKSRMRTPSSALPAWPQGFVLGRGKPLLGDAFAAAFFVLNLTTFLADFLAAAPRSCFGVFVSRCHSHFLLWVPSLVMPAKAGIQYAPIDECLLGPRFRGRPIALADGSCDSSHFLRTTLFGLRLPMRPLSVPAAGSITALISVGLPESMAASTARLSSSGDVALTPTPPNASIILS